MGALTNGYDDTEPGRVTVLLCCANTRLWLDTLREKGVRLYRSSNKRKAA